MVQPVLVLRPPARSHPLAPADHGGEHLSAAAAVLTGDVIVASDLTALQTVARINHEHRLAYSSRDQALEHAVRCGQLLIAQKEALPHGQFMEWIAINCEFEQSTATRYMTAAKRIASGVAVSSLTALFPSGRRKLEALPPPTAVHAPALEPAPADPVAEAPGAELSIDVAIAALKACTTADSRRRLKELARTGRLVKQSRRRLERAEIAQRNAVASALAAARKLREAHG